MIDGIMEPYENIRLVNQVVRQILPGPEELRVERVAAGRSTAIYRLNRNKELLYLRVLPEAEASFAPEAFVHTQLRAWQLHVPEVLYFEHTNDLLQRSIMLTTAIPGQAIGSGDRPMAVPQIVRQAGRELAQLNSLPVQGFGWVERSPEQAADKISAEFAGFQEWMAQHFEAPLGLLNQLPAFSARDCQAIHEVMKESIALFGGEKPVLAHGDFDDTHIYHLGGWYTGIIDFGEIRGTHALYDLGHFWIENEDLLPSLLEGYAEVRPLPPDYQRRICLTGLLVAARRLGCRLAQAADIHPPDVKAVRRALHLLG